MAVRTQRIQNDEAISPDPIMPIADLTNIRWIAKDPANNASAVKEDKVITGSGHFYERKITQIAIHSVGRVHLLVMKNVR